mmetsp:Transcript_16300/g.24159  ORF Transcript_16300/g.24159 Transcript_16300/m.24159 type:complete len:467 (-) Transcript_16300:466-1866(-)
MVESMFHRNTGKEREKQQLQQNGNGKQINELDKRCEERPHKEKKRFAISKMFQLRRFPCKALPRLTLPLLSMTLLVFVKNITTNVGQDSYHQYSRPRMVALDELGFLTQVSAVSVQDQEQKVRKIYVDETALSAQKNLKRSEYYEDNARDPLWEGDCQPMHSWQETSFPSCNKMHEIHMNDQVVYFAHGGYNDIFKMTDVDNKEYIVKILSYGKRYTDRNFDRVRRDAVLMERLTHSPYVVDSYSHCGFAQVVEYGRDGDLSDPLLGFYHYVTSYQKLQLATQVAQGLADAHNIDGDGISSMSHGDFKIDQYINIGGIFKLNDFNRGRFIRWDSKKLEPCTYTIEYNDGKYRSPEEYKYIPETAAIDVWALGSIFYKILTGHSVWRGTEEEEAQRLIAEGKLPQIPNEYRESEDPVDQVLLQAIQMCYVYEPRVRPKAGTVAAYLRQEAEKLDVNWQAPFKLIKKR